MSRYFISLFFLLISAMASTGYAQDRPIDLNRKDTVTYKLPYGLRAGVDLSRILVSALEDNYTGLEIVGDYRLTQNLYLAAEVGNEKKTIGINLGNEVESVEGQLYNFTASGSYIKGGIDYNTYGNWYGEQNLIFVGGRLAYSRFSQTVNDYKIFDTSRYWNPDDFAIGSTPELGFDGLSAFWLEFVVGIKAEMVKNLYFGASVRLGYLFGPPLTTEIENFQNQFIPGFNKVTEDSNFGVGYNYSITYLIPLYKKAKAQENKDGKKVAPPVEEVPTEDVPVEEVPTEDVPAEDVPTENLPVEDLPNDDIPTEDIPAEDLPNDDIPTVDLPVEENPNERR